MHCTADAVTFVAGRRLLDAIDQRLRILIYVCTKNEMRSYWIAVVVYVVAMAAVIVGVDLAFFRNRFWERLIVNIGIVLVFGALYLRFFTPP